MTAYVSELTAFLEQLRKDHPELEQSQRVARSRWWDATPPDAEEQCALRAAGVRRGSYVYYPEADGTPGG